MSKENNIAAQQKFGEAVNSRDWETIKELVADDCIEHDPAAEQEDGPKGYIDFFKMMETAFPDFKLDVETSVADDDCVAFAYTISGTNKGEFMGNDATNNKITARGMQISKFKNGKMVERWGSSDELGILKQLGIFKG